MYSASAAGSKNEVPLSVFASFRRMKNSGSAPISVSGVG
jgi:hypothetical protein